MEVIEKNAKEIGGSFGEFDDPSATPDWLPEYIVDGSLSRE